MYEDSPGAKMINVL